MLMSNIKDLDLRIETGAPSQFCPFGEEASALDYAIQYSQGLLNGTVTIGRSAEDRRIIIVSGPVRTMCLIPSKGTLKGYYEVVVGENKIIEGIAAFDEKNIERGVAQCFARKATDLLYKQEGLYMYKGKLLDLDNMHLLNNTYIYEDGTMYNNITHTVMKRYIVPKHKGSDYTKRCISLKIGEDDNTLQKIHHLVYCAYNDVSLDMLKILTNNFVDYAEWYYTSTCGDIATARTLRFGDKYKKWSVDHIDSNTDNNRVDNLQLCTVSANTTLRTLRNSGFEMIDY